MSTDKGHGSGVVVSEGKVITNFHVVAETDFTKIKIKSISNGEIVVISGVLQMNEAVDLALLDVPLLHLPPLSLAETGELAIGQRVWAIGNPLGLEGSITEGIISAFRPLDMIKMLGRQDSVLAVGNQVLGWVQTSASISPGNSGGALVDQQGRLVGVTTWKMTNGTNLNMAVHADIVRAFLGDNAQLTAILPKINATAGPERTFDETYQELFRLSGIAHEQALSIVALLNLEGEDVGEAVETAIRVVRKSLKSAGKSGEITSMVREISTSSRQHLAQVKILCRSLGFKILIAAEYAEKELGDLGNAIANDAVSRAEKFVEADIYPDALLAIEEVLEEYNGALFEETKLRLNERLIEIRTRSVNKELHIITGKITDSSTTYNEYLRLFENIESLEARFSEARRIEEFGNVKRMLQQKILMYEAVVSRCKLTISTMFINRKWSLCLESLNSLDELIRHNSADIIPWPLQQRIRSKQPWVIESRSEGVYLIRKFDLGLPSRMDFVQISGSARWMSATELTGDDKCYINNKVPAMVNDNKPFLFTSPDGVDDLIKTLRTISGLPIEIPTPKDIIDCADFELPISDPDEIERYNKITWNFTNSFEAVREAGSSKRTKLGFFDVLGNAEEMVVLPAREQGSPPILGYMGGSVARGAGGIDRFKEMSGLKLPPISLRLVLNVDLIVK